MSLDRYLVKVLLGISVLTFSLAKLLPGSPVDYILQFQEATPELRARLEAQYNLDEPVYVQYWLWLRDAAVLDFGQSLVSDRSVTDAIAGRVPDTLLLGTVGFAIAVGIGIPAGVVSAVNKGTRIDEASRIGALLGIATPNFWLGLILLLVFGVQLGLFRVIPPDSPLLSLPTLEFVILPAITLGTASAALIMRLTRSSMVEELNKDYVRTAEAKGLPERTVVLKHVLHNSLISIVTVAALQIAFIINGSVVVEQVFSWPGVGRLLVSAISQRDFPVLQAIVLLIATTVVLANLVADLLYSWLDPRIRY